MAQERHFCPVEATFLELHAQVVLCELLQDLSEMLFMLLSVLTEDKYIINVGSGEWLASSQHFADEALEG